ncbi:MAG: sensor histidine kinase, partial [Candidatus Spyradocola sp.]
YDNGQGMDDGTVRRLNDLFNQPVSGQNAEEMNAKGMGLLNVHRKIRLLQGEPYGLHVESAAGKYTRVSVLLPLLDQKPDAPGVQE